jgi:hypothetical protein
LFDDRWHIGPVEILESDGRSLAQGGIRIRVLACRLVGQAEAVKKASDSRAEFQWLRF